jgi:hypothetical protein
MRAGRDTEERRRRPSDDYRGYLDALVWLNAAEEQHRPSMDGAPALRRSCAEVRRSFDDRTNEALCWPDALEGRASTDGSSGEEG